MRLCEALGIQRGDVVAMVGAGGKTSTMLRLGNELMIDGWRVLATTTTRLAYEELRHFPQAARWRANLLRGSRDLADLLDAHRFVFIYQEIRGDKVLGIPNERVARLLDEMNADVLLVEADGSRRLPLKAPRSHEPSWPQDTTLAVVIAGLDVLGKPLDESTVYNPEPIIQRYGFPAGAPIQPAWLAQVVRDEELGLKDVPKTARIVALLNKTDYSGLLKARARRAAQMILHNPAIHSVAISAVQAPDPVLEVQRRIGAIVLAAGQSKRMGRSKPLLPWGEKTVIETIVQTLTPFNLADLVVVTGDKHKEVEKVLKKTAARTVFNPFYSVGEMLSSLKTGIQALGDEISACLVFMGDQPQVTPRTIRHVLTVGAQDIDKVIAPAFQEQRGHPILIPRKYWPNLLALTHGAPRQVINELPITVIPVDSDSILRDIDTPEQYAQEKRLAGLE